MSADRLPGDKESNLIDRDLLRIGYDGLISFWIGSDLSRSRGGSDGEAAVSAESLKLVSYGIML